MTDRTTTALTRSIHQLAHQLCAAAVTAPKTKGVNNLKTRALTRATDISRLARHMMAVAEREDKPGFRRDGLNLRACAAVVLIGTRVAPLGLTYCGLCGWHDCAAMQRARGRCAFNMIDLGIAAGSAAGLAADFRIDNRIMYSAGIGAIELNLLHDRRIRVALAIPLSVSGKNIFFDRT